MQILTRYNKVIAYNEDGFIPVGNSAILPANDTGFEGERFDDVTITDVDCVPTDINQYDYYYVDGKFIKGDIKLTGVQSCTLVASCSRLGVKDITYTLMYTEFGGWAHVSGHIGFVTYPTSTEGDVFTANVYLTQRDVNSDLAYKNDAVFTWPKSASYIHCPTRQVVQGVATMESIIARLYENYISVEVPNEDRRYTIYVNLSYPVIK